MIEVQTLPFLILLVGIAITIAIIVLRSLLQKLPQTE